MIEAKLLQSTAPQVRVSMCTAGDPSNGTSMWATLGGPEDMGHLTGCFISAMGCLKAVALTTTMMGPGGVERRVGRKKGC